MDDGVPICAYTKICKWENVCNLKFGKSSNEIQYYKMQQKGLQKISYSKSDISNSDHFKGLTPIFQ